MQFVTGIIFTLALAMGVQSSIIAWPHTHTEIAGHGLSYTAVSGPAPIWTHVPIWDHHGHAVVVQGHPWVSHWPAAWDAHAHIVDVHDHGAASSIVVDSSSGAGGNAVDVQDGSDGSSIALVAAPAHEGTYLAKTRGALHTAPLPGHANSVSSINVEPAPGTV